jgi:glucose-1-phosphate thymidylyltransferase
MKVVIMAGGYATRLWPITMTKPKPLLPVGRKTIIDHVYEKSSKFGEVFVSTNKRFEDDFKRWAEGKEVELLVENTMNEEEKLGAVKALSEVASVLNDDLLVIAGDNIFSFELDGFVNYYRLKKSCVVGLFDVGDLELVKRYSTVEMEGEKILRFYEKPLEPKSTLVGIALYVLPKYACDLLQEYVKLSEHKDNLGHFVSWLCGKTDVYGYTFSGLWHDVGNADSYIEALRFYSEHYVSERAEIDKHVKIIPPVVVCNDTVVKGRSIVGPYAYIGENCVVENSDVSESVVFKNVILRNAKIWRSIIDEECEIRNLDLSNSIIGRHAKIQRG